MKSAGQDSIRHWTNPQGEQKAPPSSTGTGELSRVPGNVRGREAYWAWPPDAVSVPGVTASDDWTSEAEPEVTPVPASTSSESMER